MVDNLKYQSAILHKDVGKCALQLLDCLFDTTELVNGNPSGQTKSKDPNRQKSIRKLDPERINYICGECLAKLCKVHLFNNSHYEFFCT